MAEDTDKRNYTRYTLKGGAEVILNISGLFGLGKKQIRLGSVVDISMGGMAIRIDKDELNSFKAAELSIVIPGRGPLIENIPFEIIADNHQSFPRDSSQLRRCGVEFKPVLGEHINRLKFIIQNYVEEKK